MAAAAILNFYFDTLDQPQCLLVDRKLVFKFRLDRVYNLEDIFNRTFRKVGSKCLFGPKKFTYFGGF